MFFKLLCLLQQMGSLLYPKEAGGVVYANDLHGDKDSPGSLAQGVCLPKPS